MGKKKTAPALEVVSEVELSNGSIIKGFSDGSFKFYPAPIELSADDVQAIFGSSEEAEEEAEEEEEDEVSIEDMKAALIESGMTKKDLKKLSDEEIAEAYEELDSEEEEEEEEEVTAEELVEMEFSDLEDLCDDKELDTDPDDFDEEDVEKLRSAIAKELGITLPKKASKKGKK